MLITIEDIVNNTKAAFLDFDRTLFVHDYPAPGEKSDTYVDDCCKWFDMPLITQRDDAPLKCMQWMVNILMLHDIDCSILTHEIFNLRDAYKKAVSLEYYGITNYYSVSKAIHKVDFILGAAKHLAIQPSQCLLVDDKMETIYAACEAGINAIYITNVMHMFDVYLESKGVI